MVSKIILSNGVNSIQLHYSVDISPHEATLMNIDIPGWILTLVTRSYHFPYRLPRGIFPFIKQGIQNNYIQRGEPQREFPPNAA